MKITLSALPSHITPIKRGYLLSGDEPLLVMEAIDTLRQAARTQHYVRQSFPLNPALESPALLTTMNTPSLFSERYLFECTFTSSTINTTLAQTCLSLCTDTQSPHAFLFVFPKLDAATLKTAHASRLMDALVFLPIWPLSREEFPAWVKQRVKQAGLPTDALLIETLCTLTEGNLLSCKQMIDRLSIFPAATLTERLAVLHDDARFTITDWIDSLARTEATRALRVLTHLEAEGSELSLLLWSIAQELRLLLLAKESREPFANFCEHHRIWPKRRPAFQQWLTRETVPRLTNALLECAKIDKVIKGAIKSDPWRLLRELTLSLTR